MNFEEWAEVYFCSADVPIACKDAWNEAVMSCAKKCEDRAKLWKDRCKYSEQYEAEDLAAKILKLRC